MFCPLQMIQHFRKSVFIHDIALILVTTFKVKRQHSTVAALTKLRGGCAAEFQLLTSDGTVIYLAVRYVDKTRQDTASLTDQMKSLQWLQKVGCLKNRGTNWWPLTSWTFFWRSAPRRCTPNPVPVGPETGWAATAPLALLLSTVCTSTASSLSWWSAMFTDARWSSASEPCRLPQQLLRNDWPRVVCAFLTAAASRRGALTGTVPHSKTESARAVQTVLTESCNGTLSCWLAHCPSVRPVALLVARRTNDRKVAGSRPTKVVCITVLTGNRMGWTARCGRPPILLRSCRKLEFRLSALMDSDLAWVNGKSGRRSWRYADTFQRSIISGAIYHFIE